jgi:hypothetical protein
VAIVFAEHFGSVANLIGEWNGALVRLDSARNALSTKAAAATAALGFQELGHQWPIFFSAEQYAHGQPARVDTLEFLWEGDALADPMTDDSVQLDRPRTDAEKVALPQLLKQRCMETERWGETRAFGTSWQEVVKLQRELDDKFLKIDLFTELSGTCSVHPGKQVKV